MFMDWVRARSCPGDESRLVFLVLTYAHTQTLLAGNRSYMSGNRSFLDGNGSYML
jgi:hypothetical protein